MSDTVVDGEPTPLPLRGCFVTGTDTEVGKTAISAGLLHLLGRRGVRVAGYKPVAAGSSWRSGASGAEGHWHNDDVEALLAASNIALTRADVCPSLFEAACAPHLAARLEGRCIEPHTLIEQMRCGRRAAALPRCRARMRCRDRLTVACRAGGPNRATVRAQCDAAGWRIGFKSGACTTRASARPCGA